MPAYERKVVYNVSKVPDAITTFEDFAAVYELLTSRVILVTPLDNNSSSYCRPVGDSATRSEKRFASTSSLNGNNGSWTNTDDVSWVEATIYVGGACAILIFGYLIGNLPERHRVYRGCVYTPYGRYDFYCAQRTDRPPSQHEVQSQINGSNGEATGSDDLDAVPTSQVGDRLRASSGIDSALSQTSSISSHTTKSTKSEDCRHWMTGKCTRERCRFNHRPEVKFSCSLKANECKPPPMPAVVLASDGLSSAKIKVDEQDLSLEVLGATPVYPEAVPIPYFYYFCLVVSCLLFPVFFVPFAWLGIWCVRKIAQFLCWTSYTAICYFFPWLRIDNTIESAHREYDTTPRYPTVNWWPFSTVQLPDPQDFMARRGLTHDTTVQVHKGLVNFLVKKYRRSNIEAHLPNSWYKSIEDYTEVLDIEVVNNSVRRAHQLLYSYHMQDVANGLYTGRAAVPVGRPN